MASKEGFYEAELRRVVGGSDWLMGILEAVRDCDPPDWLVGGGMIYKLVWNRLHGYAEAAHIKDVVFDPKNLGSERELPVERCLYARCPDASREAKNQAPVHLWYAEKFGYAVPPLRSSEEDFEANPGTATAVRVRLLTDEVLYVTAPLGLSDLFEPVLRRNPRRVTPEPFRKWVVVKGFRAKWPGVRVVEETQQAMP
jgi:uncharacterized protein